MTIAVRSQADATLANVAASATSVALFQVATSGVAARIVFNDSNVAMYVTFASVAASLTNFTVKIAIGGTFTFPAPLYGGACTAIWDTGPTGAARTTQY